MKIPSGKGRDMFDKPQGKRTDKFDKPEPKPRSPQQDGKRLAKANRLLNNRGC